ncbi:hypothetical protein ABPG72_019696 [Tetrahymena utriculariae]
MSKLEERQYFKWVGWDRWDHEQHFQNQDKLILISHNLQEVIRELRRINLLNNSSFFRCLNLKCSNRGKEIGWVNDNRIDLGYFRCSFCRKKRSLKDFSIFEGTRQMPGVYYRAIFLCFLKNLPIGAAAEYCNATIDTIRGVYQFCRGQVSQFITEL